MTYVECRELNATIIDTLLNSDTRNLAVLTSDRSLDIAELSESTIPATKIHFPATDRAINQSTITLYPTDRPSPQPQPLPISETPPSSTRFKMSSLTRFSRALRQSHSLRQPALVSNTTSIRHFTARSSALYPRKDSQDKDSMNTEATEYSKSGTDDEAARQEDAAFDPSKTSPESQKKKAGEGNEVSLLA